MMILREAIAADREAITALHLASWQTAYRDVLSDDFLDGALEGHISRQWQQTGFTGLEPTLVTEADGAVTGFASLMLKAEPYLYNIHADPSCTGQGIGTRLMRGAAEWAGRHGRTLYLHALSKNTRARAFYRRLGGVEGAGFDELLFGQPVHTIPIRWDDITVLQRATT